MEPFVIKLYEKGIAKRTARRAILITFLLMIAGAFLCAPPLYQKGYQMEPRQPFDIEQIFLLNLNTATEEDLVNLPGIGPSKAKSILQYREIHGAFESVEELLEVYGIGEELLSQLQPYVYVN